MIPAMITEIKAMLKDGSTLRIRPAQPADAPRLRQLAGKFSAHTIANILFKTLHAQSLTRLERYTDPRDPARATLLGETEIDGAWELVGVAHYWIVEPQTANFTIAVADEWHNRGVGHVLLEQLFAQARRAGLRRLHTFYSADNTPMRNLLHGLGYPPRELPDQEGAWEIQLRQECFTPPGPDKGTTP